MEQLAKRLGRDRFNNLFAGIDQSASSPSSDTPKGKVHEVSSSDDDATAAEEPAGHARLAGISNTSSPGRKRRKRSKALQKSPDKTGQGQMSVPRRTIITPQDPDPNDNPSTSSSSTRQSTNQGRRAGAYNTSGLKGPYGQIDNGFDNDKPGQRSSSTSFYGNPSTHRANEKLPSFQRSNANGGNPSRNGPISSSFPVPDKENRDNASGGTYQSSNTANSWAGAPRGLRPDKKSITMIGAAAKDRQAQVTRPMQEETLAPPARVTTSGSNTKPSTTAESAPPGFMALVPTSTSTAAASLDKGKGKARNNIIELDDESDDHDSIQEDSDASGPHVRTSKASSRARMNAGPNSSASRAIPNGNTQAKKGIYEGQTKQQGTTIHQKPPSHKANTSISDDESFSLPKEKKEKRVNNMQSRSSNLIATPNSKSKAKTKKDLLSLPLQRIVTQDGEYVPAQTELNLLISTKGVDQFFLLQGRCKPAGKQTRMKGSIPSIGDIVISPDHIACITVPKESGRAMTFMKIDIDADADASESRHPKSPFYFFQIHTRGTPQALDEEFNAVKEYFRRTPRDVFRVEWVTNREFGPLFEEARDRATAHAKEMSERGQRGRESLRQSNIEVLMKAKHEHDHQLEDVPGEDAPIIIGAKPRPKARPSAGSTLPSSFSNSLSVQQSSYRQAGSSTTVSSTEDSSSESGIDISKPGKKAPSSATNGNLVSEGSNSRKDASRGQHSKVREDRRRQSNSPELLSDKASRLSGQRQTRLAKTNADSKIMKTATSDLDDEVRPDPKLWKGRLEPEEETALVFPREGTGAVTVINSDINRLAPGEFLNDTLIEYGMKRIWQRIRDNDPSYADQIHMFSSFFYKKLSTRDRKSKTEPYKTVRKWTSKIDLFQKKYIFVPINEYFHWYLAIIVNPGRILKPPPPPSQKPTPLKRATRSSQEGVPPPIEGDQELAPITTSRFFPASQTDAKSSSLGQTTTRHRSNSIPDVFHENLPSPELPEDDRSATASPAAMDIDGESRPDGKAPQSTFDRMPEQEGSATTLDDKVKGLNLNTIVASASIPDLDDERCYIITLDSLHSKHPGVIQNLKNYLISEAKDKGKLPEDAIVAPNEADGIFRGMAAAVPQQPNMSDCGLYVLHFTEVFLQYAEELMPIMMKKVKKPPEDTNARWHHEKAEKKRAVFYDELIQESKEWKEWRAKKLAEKASETEEDVDEDEDDEGPDIEVVQQAQDAREPILPKQIAKKGKLRRYSEPESMDSDTPHITSTRRAVTPTRPKQPTSSSNKTITVEVTSPSRKSSTRRQPTPAETGEMLVDVSSNVHTKPSSSSRPLATSESPQKTGTFGLPGEPGLLEAIRGKVDRASGGLKPDGIADSTVKQLSHDPARDESLSAGGLAASNLEEDSGSEDSLAEVTDDDRGETGRTRPSSHSWFRKNRISDANEDSFKAEMIAPVARSQEVPQSRRSGLKADNSIENLTADASLYQLRTSTPCLDGDTLKRVESTLGEHAIPIPDTFSEDHFNKIQSTLGEKAAASKRPLSTDSDTLSSPVKTDKSHAHKRSRRDNPNAQPPPPYNPKRTILQSPSPAPEDISLKPPDSSQSRARTNERSRVAPSSTPAQGPPSSSQNNGPVIDISDEEDESASADVPRDAKTSSPYPSQRVKPSKAVYDEAIFVREKLGRIDR